jgi:xanthine dehydrogenase YagS FAD-binding subunit
MSPFLLVDAHDAVEAVALLQAHGPHAQLVAAGGDLLGLLKEGVRGPALPSPRVLVNLATSEKLHHIERRDDGWSLGAMATLSALARVPGLPSMLTEAISHIASPQLRARTTLGGNLLQRPRCLYFRHPDESCIKKGGTGCPAVGGPVEAYAGALTAGSCHAGHPSDLAPVFLALQASAEIWGPSGVHQVPFTKLYCGAASRAGPESTVGPDEVLVRVHAPHTTLAQAFEKVAPRDANEFATASAAVAGAVQGGRWLALRVALAGVAPEPLLLSTDEVIGQRTDAISDEVLAAKLLPAPAHGPFDTRLSAARLAVERAMHRVRTAVA